MKKLLITFLLLVLTGCTQQPCVCDDKLGASIDTEKANIDELEKLYKEAEKKYKHLKKYEIETGKYIVHEYETPKGEVGYQIIKDDGKYLESVCVGVECDGKNYKKEIIESSTEDISSSTDAVK
jgi:hypothetical protein